MSTYPSARANRSACSRSWRAWLPVAGDPDATRDTRETW